MQVIIVMTGLPSIIHLSCSSHEEPCPSESDGPGKVGFLRISQQGEKKVTPEPGPQHVFAG